MPYVFATYASQLALAFIHGIYLEHYILAFAFCKIFCPVVYSSNYFEPKAINRLTNGFTQFRI